MLREYQLENFKAFAGPETIPVRPITLIYGPNSSGKSSILQSLLLLKQTLEEASPETVLLPKGARVDLGGYRDFVHRHDVSREFSFTALFTLDVEEYESRWVGGLLKNVNPSCVGLNIRFAYEENGQTIVPSCIEVFVGDKSLPLISYRPGRPYRVVAADVNRKHGFWYAWWTFMKQDIQKYIRGMMGHGGYVNCNGVRFIDRELEKMKDYSEEENPYVLLLEHLQQDLTNYSFEKAIEDLESENSLLCFGYQNFLPVTQGAWPAEYHEAERKLMDKLLDKFLKEYSEGGREQAQPGQSFLPPDSLENPYIEAFCKKRSPDSPFSVEIFYPEDEFTGEPPFSFKVGLDVSPLTFHVSSVFRHLVRRMVYLGPLRNYPERHYVFGGDISEGVGKSGERMPDILFKNPELVNLVNAELDRLGFGYELKMSTLRDEDSNHSNVFALRVVDKQTDVSANVQDIGFGVSQVLPIIVQSLLSQNKTLLIEQPEIHLHPALQAELGDLFIKSALGEQKNTFLLETHSEHLLLRIMRRMRETANGTLPAGIPPVKPEDVSVLYVQRKDAASVVRVLELDQEGQLLDPWPGGFFEEGFRERFA
jgi:hypothetical protein